MANQNGVYDYSTTAANNVSPDGTDVSGTTGKVKDGDNVMRSMMAHTAAFAQDLGGAKTTTGSANAQAVTLTQTITALGNGIVFRVKWGFTNTGAATLNVNSLGAKSIKVNTSGASTDPQAGDIQAGNYGTLLYDGTNFILMNPTQQVRYAPGTLYGLTLQNSGSNGLSISAGSCRDSTDADNIVLAALTAKDLSTLWAVGSSAGLLDLGTVGNGTYHVYAIKRPDTGVTDLIASISATAPTLPTNYTLFRRVGSVVRSGGSIVPFFQNGDEFIWKNLQQDADGATLGATTATALSLTVPGGIKVNALVSCRISSVNSTSVVNAQFYSFDGTDSASSSTNFDIRTPIVPSGQSYVGQLAKSIRTDTAGRIRIRADVITSMTYNVTTSGYVDTRGRV